MTLLNLLSDAETWEKFYKYKLSLACPKDFLKELRSFIDEKAYISVCQSILSGKDFPLAHKSVISKQSSLKKRTVYTYPKAENIVLKLLTYLLLRKYDYLFSDNLFSFRPGLGAMDAIRMLKKNKNLKDMYSYKVDVSNYFNSVPIDEFLPVLYDAVGEDRELYEFLCKLLSEERTIFNGVETIEEKGIMAGTPLACFYANLYLKDLDEKFSKLNVSYARYSDDIILFAESKEKLSEYADIVRDTLFKKGLSVNPDKEVFFDPVDGFTFLGFSVKGGKIDISPVSVYKLKKKMYRKTRALKRWQKRGDIEPERAAAAFIRIFNRKLLESTGDSDLTWSYWFFSTITTSEGLHEIDIYAQECLRYLISDKRTKARYNVRYEDLKALGYKSLVHAYYDFRKEKGD